MNSDEEVRAVIIKNRTCTRKQKYIYYELAEEVKNRALRKRFVELRIYKCEFCGCFHLTKKNTRSSLMKMFEMTTAQEAGMTDEDFFCSEPPPNAEVCSGCMMDGCPLRRI